MQYIKYIDKIYFMKIHLNNSEAQCLKELEEIKADAFGYRAVLVKLSTNHNKGNSLARLIIADVSKLLEGAKASIYIFKDYDILIIYQGLSIKLSESITYKLSDLIKEDANKILRVYDLEKNSEIIKSICQKKLELYDIEEKAKLRSEQEVITEAKGSQEPLDIKIDKSLLESLSFRRSAHTKTKILLVEDDPFSRRLVKNILQNEFDVVEAEDGRDALAKYISYAPNIVFLDINLPDCTGMQLLEKLVTIDARSYIVMLSGNSFKDNILVSVKKGAKGFVAKPFPKDKIFHYIEKYQQEKNKNQ